MDEGKFLSLIVFCSLDQIPKTENFHKISYKDPKFIGGRCIFIAEDILDIEEVLNDGMVVDDDKYFYEGGGCGSVEAGVSTDLAAAEKKGGGGASGCEFHFSFTLYI